MKSSAAANMNYYQGPQHPFDTPRVSFPHPYILVRLALLMGLATKVWRLLKYIYSERKKSNCLFSLCSSAAWGVAPMWRQSCSKDVICFQIGYPSRFLKFDYTGICFSFMARNEDFSSSHCAGDNVCVLMDIGLAQAITVRSENVMAYACMKNTPYWSWSWRSNVTKAMTRLYSFFRSKMFCLTWSLTVWCLTTTAVVLVSHTEDCDVCKWLMNEGGNKLQKWIILKMKMKIRTFLHVYDSSHGLWSVLLLVVKESLTLTLTKV